MSSDMTVSSLPDSSSLASRYLSLSTLYMAATPHAAPSVISGYIHDRMRLASGSSSCHSDTMYACLSSMSSCMPSSLAAPTNIMSCPMPSSGILADMTACPAEPVYITPRATPSTRVTASPSESKVGLTCVLAMSWLSECMNALAVPGGLRGAPSFSSQT